MVHTPSLLLKCVSLLLPKDSPRSAVPELGIEVRKVIAYDNDPVKSVLAFLRRHPPDLIVRATHQHAPPPERALDSM